MRIVLATPLYPPEVADAAAYAKELARRLALRHAVTVVAYAHLPETIEGVDIVTVDKRQPRFTRLRAFRKALAQAAHGANAVIAVNGASVEAALLSTALPKTILCIADTAAHARSGLLERFARIRVQAIVRDVPGPKPEILPLEPSPTEALTKWEAAWVAHLKTLERALNHGN